MTDKHRLSLSRIIQSAWLNGVELWVILFIVGVATWFAFFLLTEPVVANPFVLALLIAGGLIIPPFLFYGFWVGLRLSWPSNLWPAFIALVYVSQFIALVSTLDWTIASRFQHSFTGGQHAYGLTKIDAFYFAVTTFATVGYGDIHANDPVAKLVVAFQIILGLLLSLIFLGVFVSQLVSRLSNKELKRQ